MYANSAANLLATCSREGRGKTGNRAESFFWASEPDQCGLPSLHYPTPKSSKAPLAEKNIQTCVSAPCFFLRFGSRSCTRDGAARLALSYEPKCWRHSLEPAPSQFQFLGGRCVAGAKKWRFRGRSVGRASSARRRARTQRHSPLLGLANLWGRGRLPTFEHVRPRRFVHSQYLATSNLATAPAPAHHLTSPAYLLPATCRPVVCCSLFAVRGTLPTICRVCPWFLPFLLWLASSAKRKKKPFEDSKTIATPPPSYSPQKRAQRRHQEPLSRAHHSQAGTRATTK